MEITEIDKNTFLKMLKSYEDYFVDEMNYDAIQMVRFIVHLWENIPTINKDVHAKWTDTYRNGYKPPNVIVCEHCNYWNDKPKDYCPNCGAKMDCGIEWNGMD